MSRIAPIFERARAARRAAFIPYLTAGDPSPESTVSLARVLEEAGAGILELGVPFSDPIADGPVLQRAAARALEGGMTLGTVFEIARTIRQASALPLLLFSYLNPLLARGLRLAARHAYEAGFDAVLVTDLPPEEASEVQPIFRAAGLDTVFLVSPTSPPGRMSRAARLSSGFLYVVSRPGTTGAREGLPEDLDRTLRRARKAAGRLPLAVGFGISTEEGAARAARLADGVVVGSAIVAAAEEAGEGRLEAVAVLARALARGCAATTE